MHIFRRPIKSSQVVDALSLFALQLCRLANLEYTRHHTWLLLMAFPGAHDILRSRFMLGIEIPGGCPETVSVTK